MYACYTVRVRVRDPGGMEQCAQREGQEVQVIGFLDSLHPRRAHIRRRRYYQFVAEALYFTDSDDANELIAKDPLALLIGFALDQQVTVPTAFLGPLKLKQRLGGELDAAKIVAIDPAEFEGLFRQRPAIHRFPGSMARRVQELCAVLLEEYEGDAERVWTEATDTADLRRRVGSLPGFGDMKIIGLGSVLALRFGVEAAAELVPSYPCLGGVDSPEALAEYQAAKRAHKSALRAAAASA